MPDKTYEFIGDVNTKESALAEALRGVGVFVYEGKGESILSSHAVHFDFLQRKSLFVVGYGGLTEDRRWLEQFPGQVILVTSSGADDLVDFFASRHCASALGELERRMTPVTAVDASHVSSHQEDELRTVYVLEFHSKYSPRRLQSSVYTGDCFRIVESRRAEIESTRIRMRIEELWELREKSEHDSAEPGGSGKPFSDVDQFHGLLDLLKSIDFSDADEFARATLLDCGFPKSDDPEALPFVESYCYEDLQNSLFNGCEDRDLPLRASAFAIYLTLGTMYMHRGEAHKLAAVVGTASLRRALGLTTDGLNDWDGFFKFEKGSVQVDSIKEKDWAELQRDHPVLYSCLRIRSVAQLAVYCVDLVPRAEAFRIIEQLCEGMQAAIIKPKEKELAGLLETDFLSTEAQAYRGTVLQVSLYRFRMTLEESYLTRALHFSSEYKDHAPVGAAYYARGLNYRQSVLCERLFRALSREDGLAAATVDELARNETGRGPVRTAISSGCDHYDLNCLLQATAIARLASGAASCATLERMTRDSLVSVAHWGEAIHGSRGYKPMLGLSHGLLLAATGFFPAQDFSSLAEVGRGYWTSRVHDKAHMRGSILHYVSLKYWACYSAYLWSREEYARAADVARLAVDITNGPFHRVVQTMTKPERILDHFKKISKPSSFENASEAARSALEVCHAVSY